MAEEIHQFDCVITHGTAKSSPLTIPMALPLYQVDSIDVQVPPGPAGLMGFYLELGTQQWIPWERGTWIVWDDHIATWALDDSPSSETWALVGYNTGAYDHTVTVRFHLNAVATPTAPLPLEAPIPQVNIIESGVTFEPVLL